MCIYSAIYPQTAPWINSIPELPSASDIENARLLQEILERVKKLDEKLNLRECRETEDAKKILEDKIRQVLDGQ